MKTCYTLSLCLLIAGRVANAQAATSTRFKDPEGITADPTGLRRDPSVRVAPPKMPRDFATSRTTGAPIVAFVIDTTGQVEIETVSFVRTSRPEFMKAVCDMLPRFRYLPFMVGEQKWRVLLVESFAFTVGLQIDTSATALAARMQEDFATKPIAKVVEQLSPLPQCPSPASP
jgi:hypothetical protein